MSSHHELDYILGTRCFGAQTASEATKIQISQRRAMFHFSRRSFHSQIYTTSTLVAIFSVLILTTNPGYHVLKLIILVLVCHLDKLCDFLFQVTNYMLHIVNGCMYGNIPSHNCAQTWKQTTLRTESVICKSNKVVNIESPETVFGKELLTQDYLVGDSAACCRLVA